MEASRCHVLKMVNTDLFNCLWLSRKRTENSDRSYRTDNRGTSCEGLSSRQGVFRIFFKAPGLGFVIDTNARRYNFSLSASVCLLGEGVQIWAQAMTETKVIDKLLSYWLLKGTIRELYHIKISPRPTWQFSRAARSIIWHLWPSKPSGQFLGFLTSSCSLTGFGMLSGLRYVYEICNVILI